MRATDTGGARGHLLARLVETLLGLVITAAGIAVFFKQPEHGELLSLALVASGCAMIDRRLMRPSNLKKILER